jgi:hypothetical protein
LAAVADADPVSGPVLVVAFLRGVVMASVLVLCAWLLGLFPAGSEGYGALGCGAALLASGAALLLHGRILDRRAGKNASSNSGRAIAARLQTLLATGLLLKLAAVTIGVLSLRSQQVKFEGIAAFAVAFAAASLVCQLTAAGTLVRALSSRPGQQTVAGRTGGTS